MLSRRAHEPTRNTSQEPGEILQQEGSLSRVLWYRSWMRDRFFLLAAVPLALFTPLAWWIRRHPLTSIDMAITEACQKHQPPFLKKTTFALSCLAGSPLLLGTLVVPTTVAFWKLRLRLEAAMTVALFVVSTLVRIPVQRLVDRPRPSNKPWQITDRNKRRTSFPSGHVISSVTFWGWLFAVGSILWQGNSSRQKALLSLPALFVVFTGPARIYLCEHWASDVLGGYLFGGTWLSLSLWLYLTLRKKEVLL